MLIFESLAGGIRIPTPLSKFFASSRTALARDASFASAEVAVLTFPAPLLLLSVQPLPTCHAHSRSPPLLEPFTRSVRPIFTLIVAPLQPRLELAVLGGLPHSTVFLWRCVSSILLASSPNAFSLWCWASRSSRTSCLCIARICSTSLKACSCFSCRLTTTLSFRQQPCLKIRDFLRL